MAQPFRFIDLNDEYRKPFDSGSDVRILELAKFSREELALRSPPLERPKTRWDARIDRVENARSFRFAHLRRKNQFKGRKPFRDRKARILSKLHTKSDPVFEDYQARMFEWVMALEVQAWREPGESMNELPAKFLAWQLLTGKSGLADMLPDCRS
jgi:hypothetical protein